MSQFSKNGIRKGVPSRIDFRNPISNRLTYLIAPGVSSNPIDFVKGQKMTVSPGTRTSTPWGVGSAGWEGTPAETEYLNYTGGAFSLFAYVTFTEPIDGNYSKILSRDAYQSEGSNQGWGLETDNFRRFRFLCLNNTSSSSYALDSTTRFEFGRAYTVLGTTDGAIRKIYVNGRLDGTSPDGLTCASNTTVGIKNDIVSGRSNIVMVAAVWRRALSATDAQMLNANPWGLFQTDDNFRLYSPSSGPPPAPSMDSWYMPLWTPPDPIIEVVSI